MKGYATMVKAPDGDGPAVYVVSASFPCPRCEERVSAQGMTATERSDYLGVTVRPDETGVTLGLTNQGAVFHFTTHVCADLYPPNKPKPPYDWADEDPWDDGGDYDWEP